MSVILATVVLFIAPLALLVHSGMPVRVWRLFYNINITSQISFGSFLLTLYPLNCLIYGYFIFREKMKLTKIFGIIGIPLAVSVHGYCGFILGCAKARHLWNSALMPILFLVSAIVSGVAVIIFLTYIKDRFFSEEKKLNEELLYGLGGIMAAFLLLDLFLVLSDVIILFVGSSEEIRVAELLTTGNFAFPFLFMENFLGKIVPVLLILITRIRTANRVVIASVLVIIGIYFMRYVVVYAGEYYQLI
jgi:formate-dependent nitrite reductase membrane component NrfD